MGVGGARRDVRFGVLGELFVEVDGRSVPAGGPKQRALLVRLLLSAPHPVSTDRLVDDLWPDGGPPTAGGTLQAYVSRLRRVVGAEVLCRDAAGYRLDVDPEVIDVRRFQARLGDARRAVASGDDEAAARLLDVALSWWRGDPAIEWYDLTSASAELTVLDEQRSDAVRLRAEVALRLDDPTTAVVVLEPAVERHALDETMWVLLASALGRQGRRAEAGAALHRAMECLDAEGWEPGPLLAAALARHRRLDDRETGAVPIVGRAAQIDAVVELTTTERVVSLVGVGGVGKTCLAGAVVDELVVREPDLVVHRVDLAGLGERGDPVREVARVTGAAELPDRSPLDALVQQLGGRALLVLDTCELVIDRVVPLIEAMIAGTAEVRVLATSRVALDLVDEVVVPVEPLGRPSGETLEEVEASSSAQLLGAAANHAFRGFRISTANAPAVASIVRHLGGLPLALRVAGAHLAATTPQQLADRLEEGFPGWLEDGEPEDVRHATLRATLDWSFEALPPPAQDVLLAVSVFAGPFTADAASQVVGGDLGAQRCSDLLDLLVGRSMLESVTADRVARYAFHSIVQGYSQNRLRSSRGLDDAQTRHLEFMTGVVRRNVAGLRGPDEMRGVALLRSWSIDIDAVLDRLLDQDHIATAAELAADVVWWWYFDGRLRSAVERIERIASVIGPADAVEAAHAELLAALGMMLAELEPSTAAGREASYAGMTLAAGCGDEHLEALTTMAHADALTMAGPVLDAEPFLDEAERAFGALGCDWGVGWARARRLRAMPARRTSAAAARVEVGRAAEALTAAGDRRGLAYLHLIATNIERLDGRPRAALLEAQAALAAFEEMQDPIQLAKALRGVLLSSVQIGDVGAAREGLRRFDRLLERHPVPLWRLWASWGAAEVALVEGRDQDAVEIGERILRHLDDHGELPDAPLARGVHVRALLAVGRSDEADAMARAHLAELRQDPGSGFTAGEAAWIAAQAALAVGDRRRFVQGCRRAMRSFAAVGADASIAEIVDGVAESQAAVGRHRLAAALRAGESAVAS